MCNIFDPIVHYTFLEVEFVAIHENIYNRRDITPLNIVLRCVLNVAEIELLDSVSLKIIEFCK